MAHNMGMLTNMVLVARVHGEEYELGAMTVDVPLRMSSEDPRFLEVADIKPTLAAALREAADEIEGVDKADE